MESCELEGEGVGSDGALVNTDGSQAFVRDVTLAGDTTYTNEDRALLAGVSAAVLSDEKVKKMRVE